MGLLDRMSSNGAAAPSVQPPPDVDGDHRDTEPASPFDASQEFALLRRGPEEPEAAPMVVRRFNIGHAKKDPFRHIREKVQQTLLRESNRYLKLDDRQAVHQQITTLLDEALAEDQIQPARVDYMRILDAITFEVLGYGPIQPL